MKAAGKRKQEGFLDNIKGDSIVWIIVLLLFLTSIVCIFSSTSKLVDATHTRVDFVLAQIKLVAAGTVILVVCYFFKLKWFRVLSAFGFPLSLLLLLLLVSQIDVPGLKSIELNGARRILKTGNIQIHVFEIVKVAMVMYLAWAQDAIKRGVIRKPADERWKKILFIYAPFLITFMLLMTGSNSAAVFVGTIMFVVILLGGGNMRDMFALAGAGLLLLSLCFGLFKISDGKCFNRIGTGINRIFEPEDWEKIVLESRTGSVDYYNALDKIRQQYSAKIAVHEGGLLGKGPGQSTQRYVVPDMSEDFMYSFILEEYGLWGGIIVLMLYVSLLARGSIIVKNCGDDLYAKLTAAGLTMLISGQAMLHMFVNADIGPMTGQTLPLISHGDSAFLCFCIAFGVLLCISRYAGEGIAEEQDNARPLLDDNAEDSIREVESIDL